MKNQIGNKEDAKRKLKNHLESLAVKKKPYVPAQAYNEPSSADKRKS